MNQAIEREQRESWQRGTPISIESLVERFPQLADNSSALFDLIAAEINLRRQRGEKADIGEYERRFPQCAGRLRQLFDEPPADTDLSSSGTLIRPPELQAGSVASLPEYEASAEAAAASEVPAIVGFEILGELGRGGMGIVYRARQLSADRVVALKVVRTDVLASLPLASQASTLERFRHEAQAAAKLEHDNLVSVYEVGEAGNRAYYAMKYVAGKSLHALVKDGPLENRRAAKYLEPVARALHLAHQHGILHRDLKPHNILVDERSDRPLLTDFGLAKFLERQHDLTVAGEVMGTPSYMSPEQALDPSKVSAAADVYSLGATLYHVLTGRAPFVSASMAETIRQIFDDEPVPVWVLNPAVDRDLETICLKCLEKDPAKRYTSAEALADDLARYLEGRPIVARPVGPIERSWRWCRRNPRVASLLALVATLAVTAVTAIVVGYVQTTAALAESERRLDQALEVVNDLFTRFSEDELLDEPGMQPLRHDLLNRALTHYNDLLSHSRGNARVQDEVAAAQFRVGRITDLIGAPDAARFHLDTARKMQEELLAAQPDDLKRLRALADTLNALGSLHSERKEPDEALKSYSRAAEIRGRMVAAQKDNAEFRRLLANTWMNLGIVAGEQEDATRAAAEMDRAQTLRLELLRADSQFSKARRDLAMGYYQLAKLKLRQEERKPDEAAAHLQSAIEQFALLPPDDARSLRNRYFLAVCHRSLAAIQESQEQFEQALASYERASEPMETLAVGNPDVPLYHRELAVLALQKAVLYEDRGDLASARAAWLQMLRSARSLAARDPDDVDCRIDLATALAGIGGLELLAQHTAQAVEPLREARDLLKKLTAELPEDPNLKQQLADAEANLATAEKGN